MVPGFIENHAFTPDLMETHVFPGRPSCQSLSQSIQSSRNQRKPIGKPWASHGHDTSYGPQPTQLAELVGTTQSAIARLEGGRISPSLPTLDRIANALDADLTVSLTDTQQLLGSR